jgi:16S rRNA (guanine527-N7)-methyltransferase
MTNSALSPEGFIAELSSLGQNVSRETFSGLEIYAALLVKWQKAINLVSPDSLKDLWRRHFLDSAQLLPLLPEGEDAITDFGSGGGFPGLVLAILTKRQVHLIESDARKCAFLREVAHAAGIGPRVTVHNKRFDQLQAWPAPAITARACANLGELLEHVAPFLAPETVCLFLKGAKADDELTEARRHWNMLLERRRSVTDSSGTILILKDLKRRDKP